MAIAPANLPRLSEISVDPIVLAFNFCTALVSGVLFGIIPVFKYAGPRIATPLRSGGRTSSQTRERRRTRGILVVVQVALAVTLLVGSGLMIRTFYALRHVDRGLTRMTRSLCASPSRPRRCRTSRGGTPGAIDPSKDPGASGRDFGGNDHIYSHRLGRRALPQVYARDKTSTTVFRRCAGRSSSRRGFWQPWATG